MRSTKHIVLTFIILFTAFSFGQSFENYYSSPKFFAGGMIGYNGGFGIQLNGAVSHFSKSFPFSVRLGIEYTTNDAGKPNEARKIFINDATNGIPEESGSFWDFRFDLLYNIKLFSLNRSFLFGGVRYSRFIANFKYVGGNEDFDIRSNQLGLGGGLETYFPIASNFNMVLTAGVDYYFTSTLQGHDTSYNPDNENINPRKDYTFSDADNAVNQPKILPRVMFGFNYGF